MKYLIILISVVFVSCNNEEDIIDPSSPILGSWQLTKILRDPGDGSGTYKPVTSDQTLTFLASGRVVSNSDFCKMSGDTGSTFSAYFIVSEDKNEGVISSLDCPNFKLLFRIDEDHLVIA